MKDLTMTAQAGELLAMLLDDDICPPAKAEIKDFHSRGQIPKAQKKNPWPAIK